VLGFLDAATYPLRGLGFLFRHPRLWPPAAAAFGVNLLIFTAGMVAFVVFLPDLARAATPDRFPAWSAWFIGALIALAGLLAAVFLFTIVGNLVAGPFLEVVAERALRELGESPPPSPPLARAILRSVASQLLKLVLFGLLQAALLLTLPLGPVYPVLAGGVAAFFFALEYLDYPLGARGLGAAARPRWVARRLSPSLGFGAACLMVHLVPLLGYAALPASVCGAVLLARRLDAGPSKS
jgi:CysZ protein